MAIEIELKARVDDPEKVRNLLASLGNYRCGYLKKDSYWTFPEKDAARIRIRNELKTFPTGKHEQIIMVNCKRRELCDEIEVNNEQEFSISDAESFEEILVQMGMVPDIKKEKQGWVWEFKNENENAPLFAELSEVKGLGWFLELEIINKTREDSIIEENRSRLLELLEKLGIDRAKLETRPYSELIRTINNQ